MKLFTKLFLAVLVIFAAGCSAEKEKENSLVSYKLNGKVKTLKTVVHKAIDTVGIIVKGELSAPDNQYPVNIISFNEDGYIVEYKVSGSLNSFEQRLEYKYNEDFNRTGLAFYNSKNEVTRKYDITYNGKNPVESYYYDDKGKITGKETYVYDDNGNELSSSSYDADGTFRYKFERKYDKNNNEIEWLGINPNGRKETRQVWEYNDKGLKTVKYFYERYDSLINKETFKYDEKGNLVEHNAFTPEGGQGFFSNDHAFDKNNYVLGDTILSRIVNKYDENNNLIERYFYDNKGKVYLTYEYKYKYDEAKNWIQKIEYIDKKPVWIEEREIEYYK